MMLPPEHTAHEDKLLADRLVERLFRYLAVTSQSSAAATAVPSTPGQWDMVRLLAAELEPLGLADIHIDAQCHTDGTAAGNGGGRAEHRLLRACRHGGCRPVHPTSIRSASASMGATCA